MLKNLLCTAVFLISATALRADVFSFSYAGGGVSESGTITATSLGLGLYTVTDLTGTRNGAALSIPLGGGVFSFLSSSNYSGSLIFSVAGNLWTGGLDTINFDSGKSDSESFSAIVGGGATTGTFTLAKGASMPEPTTLSLLFVMGLGVWAVVRRTSAKKSSIS